MKITENPKLINEKAIDVAVDIARRTAPNGWKLNEEDARRLCKKLLTYGGICLESIVVRCPNACRHASECFCGLYVPSK